MKYKTTLIKCVYKNNKNVDKESEFILPDLVPPSEPGSWSIVNFQPCASPSPYDSAYLVVWASE